MEMVSLKFHRCASELCVLRLTLRVNIIPSLDMQLRAYPELRSALLYGASSACAEDGSFLLSSTTTEGPARPLPSTTVYAAGAPP